MLSVPSVFCSVVSYRRHCPRYLKDYREEHFSFFTLVGDNVDVLAKIVASPTVCACNLNRKAGVAKVRFSTAVRGTSWQSFIDGSRWKRVVVLAS